MALFSRSRSSAPRSRDPILVVEGLDVYHGRAHALQGVGFTLVRGVFGIVGRNGMGKTTLCNALTGLVQRAAKYIEEGKPTRLSGYGDILYYGFYDLNGVQADFFAAVAKAWQHGTVIRSWLLELAGLAFEQHGEDLGDIRGWVAVSGEGRWTIREAINLDVPAPVITLSLLARFASRQDESFSAKVTAALRQPFGGHAVKSE